MSSEALESSEVSPIRRKKRRMTVSDIMTSEVITAGMDDTVEEIAKIFEQKHIHHIPILEGTRIVGVVSDRDVLKAISPFANTRSPFFGLPVLTDSIAFSSLQAFLSARIRPSARKF